MLLYSSRCLFIIPLVAAWSARTLGIKYSHSCPWHEGSLRAIHRQATSSDLNWLKIAPALSPRVKSSCCTALKGSVLSSLQFSECQPLRVAPDALCPEGRGKTGQQKPEGEPQIIVITRMFQRKAQLSGNLRARHGWVRASCGQCLGDEYPDRWRRRDWLPN